MIALARPGRDGSTPLVALAVTVALMASARTPAHAQTPAAPEAGPSSVHLVGHEDAALLARVQEVIDDWDPRRLQNPYLKSVPAEVGGARTTRLAVRRPDLLEFIADAEVAVALGKAFFWEMKAGSDYRRRQVGDRPVYYGTACASCHYQNGTDARNRHTSRIPYVAWDQFQLDPAHPAKAPTNPGDPNYPEGEFRQWPFTPNADPAGEDQAKRVALIVGSQGVEPRKFKGLNPAPTPTGDWYSEASDLRSLTQYTYKPEWSMFLEQPGMGGRGLRQITNRNSPTTANAVFADRQFHDGRAESTFNGFSIFGDHDRRQVLFRRRPDGTVAPVRVAIPKASLASQAVGPIVNEVEMSYLGRTFPDLADKLLPSPWLEHQTVSPDDSVLSARALYADDARTQPLTYEQLIRKAFRTDWLDDPAVPSPVTLVLRSECAEEGDVTEGRLIQANFPLFWGLSLMLYQSTLITDKTPFDEMMQGRGEAVNARWDEDYKAILGPIVRADLAPVRGDGSGPKLELKTGTEVFQLGFRTFLNRGCVECHAGPLFSEVSDRIAVAVPEPNQPIAFAIERALLPFAQSEAIALRVHAYRESTELGLHAELNVLGIPAARRGDWVGTLWRLLERAGGNLGRLEALVGEALNGGNPVDAAAPERPRYAAIARLLMTYEKTVSTRVGGRAFFTEDERVALAESLTADLLVEKMLIAPRQRMIPPPGPGHVTRPVIRPRLPIEGPLASEAYAFYDTGFYALGVSPPRFDRGVGNWVVGNEEIGAGEATRPGPDPDDPTPTRSIEGIEKRQAAGGARGRAYRLPPVTRMGPPVEGKRRRVTPNPPAQCDPDTDPATTADARDLSWSRSVIPPGSGVPDLDIDERRSQQHFFSRARRLVFNEEPAGHRKPLLHDNELAFWGAFRTPSLRNVELTPPYMHNGRLYTLNAVLGFYDNGGALWQRPDTNTDKHPAMVPLHMTPDEQKGLLFFLACLTDPRLRVESAPFDHPSLIVVNGYGPIGGVVGDEQLVEVDSVGRAGHGALPPLPRFPAE